MIANWWQMRDSRKLPKTGGIEVVLHACKKSKCVNTGYPTILYPTSPPFFHHFATSDPGWALIRVGQAEKRPRFVRNCKRLSATPLERETKRIEPDNQCLISVLVQR